jgi:pseudouridine-5'-phosphate glycosidase
VAVVCSGVKSILDVPATLEYLETAGVPVVGFRTRRFPGFYLTDSGQTVDWSVEDEEEAARLVLALAELGRSGLVIANPLAEGDQLDPETHDRALRAGLDEMERRGCGGKDVTPFSGPFREETGGESLRVNKKIIEGNARLAARVAVSLAGLS